MINRNKLGVAIDLTQADGRDLALRLVERADAVIENQATGVMDKLGLSYEELRAVNPEIIMLSLPAFGAEGPWSGYRGYGSTVEHGAGLPHLTGGPDDPPMMTHVAYGDACGGMNAAAALLVGLFHRKRTGQGQRIDLSQVEGVLQQGVHGTIAQGLNGAPPPRTGNRHPVFTPHGVFACAEPDNWLVVAVTGDEQWPGLCQVIGRADLGADPALSSAEGRRDQEDEIEAAIAVWAKTLAGDAAMQALQDAGVAAGVARRPSELSQDPDREVVGVKPQPQTPWRFNGERGPLRRPSPLLGEHNGEVLGRVLGLTADEIAALEGAGIIGDKPVIPA
jgi:crotonobetainyl-CoA:carnitine CoA-transferase CaiB-like acyl-CoA transferase